MPDKLQHILKQDEFTSEELAFLLERTEPDSVNAIYQAADVVRREYCGEAIHLRGIIEFSNYCRRNCDYCGLRSRNKTIHRFRLADDEIMETIELIAEVGIPTVVLQSGEDFYWTRQRIAELIRHIKEQFGLAITLSLGERDRQTYQEWFDAGADRYLLKIETSNPKIYKAIHPDCLFHERIRCLDDLRAIGYQVGSGFMVGLPGQTLEDLAQDILFLKKYDFDMAGVGPFLPHDETPLAKLSPVSMDLALKVLALSRLVLKNTHLPATTSLETLDSGGRIRALQSGANVIMPNFTPFQYRGDYMIYPNKAGSDMEALALLAAVRAEIHSLGRTIATDAGHTLKR